MQMKMQSVWKLGLAMVLAILAGRNASATDTTLVGDAHVNAAHPTVNYGTVSNLYVGGGYTSLLQVRSQFPSRRHDRIADLEGNDSGVRESRVFPSDLEHSTGDRRLG